MFRVLLVDDEESVLKVLTSSVDWQSLGVSHVLTAMDGLEALDYFQQNQKIDLLITDIRMPGMDGLELFRRVREISPETHCILLTAYGDFEYAREAIRLGVENYLLKPIVKDEIELTVQNALNNIYAERQSNEGLLRENTLRRWTKGAIGCEELCDRAAVLGINLFQPQYFVICIAKKSTASIAAFRSVCIDNLKQMGYDVNAFWDEKDRYIIIAGGREILPDTLVNKLKQNGDFENAADIAVFSIGIVVDGADDLHLSYQTATDAIELSDPNSGDIYADLSKGVSVRSMDRLIEEIRLLFFESEGKKDDTDIRRFATKISQNGFSSEQAVRLTRACIKVLIDEFPLEQNLQKIMYSKIQSMDWTCNEDELLNLICTFVSTAQQVYIECFTKRSAIVQHMIRYIRNGVFGGQSVSLKEFSVQNGMNSSYLGHLFKTETGVFFNDYLNQCRIERAIILLHNPYLKIKDIAEKLGFMYSSHFIKCFKEHKGVSPTVYREEQLVKDV